MARLPRGRAPASAGMDMSASPTTPVVSGGGESFTDRAEAGRLVRTGSAMLGMDVPGASTMAQLREVGTPPKASKRKHAKIDLDDNIAAAAAKVKEAKANYKKAQLDTRNERRKKTRIVKKAAQLSCEDLERIAVLKRVGLWNPALGTTVEWPVAPPSTPAEPPAPVIGAAEETSVVVAPSPDEPPSAEPVPEEPEE